MTPSLERPGQYRVFADFRDLDGNKFCSLCRPELGEETPMTGLRAVGGLTC
jgi:hypothetical protein